MFNLEITNIEINGTTYPAAFCAGALYAAAENHGQTLSNFITDIQRGQSKPLWSFFAEAIKLGCDATDNAPKLPANFGWVHVANMVGFDAPKIVEITKIAMSKIAPNLSADDQVNATEDVKEDGADVNEKKSNSRATT